MFALFKPRGEVSVPCELYSVAAPIQVPMINAGGLGTDLRATVLESDHVSQDIAVIISNPTLY